MDRGGIRRNYRRIKSVGPCLAGCALPITPIDTTKPWSPRATDCHPAFGPGVVWRRIHQGLRLVRHVMTLEEVAQLLRCHPSTIYRLVKRGKIPAFALAQTDVSMPSK
jgi:hypothetical protein